MMAVGQRFLLFLCSFVVLSAGLQAREGLFKAKLTKIDISQLSNILPTSVAGSLPVAVGQEYDFYKNPSQDVPSAIAGSIAFDDPQLGQGIFKTVDKMGYFKKNVSYVLQEVVGSGVQLKVNLEEKPLLGNVKFNGNKHFGAQKLSKVVSAATPDQALIFYDEYDLEQAVKKIEALYRNDGYLAVDVKAESTFVDHRMDIVFTITEGSHTKVAKLNFHGCAAVNEGALRGIMYTNENWLFGYATGSGKFDKTMLACDKGLIERFYQNKGYAKATVCDIKSSERQDGDIVLDYYIDEGQRYNISRFVLPFDSEVSDQDVLSANLLVTGKSYSAEVVERTAKRLEYLFGKKGYLHAACLPIPTFDDKDGSVEITFDVRKGEKFSVRHVSFFGNHRTRESVLRREMLFSEASLANKGLIDMTIDRLKYLGIFENVSVRYKEVSPGVVDLIFQIEEKKHLNSLNFALNIGAGENGAAEPSVDFAYKRINFGGLGIDIETNVRHNWKALSDVGLGFHNPSVGDKGIGLSSEFYYKKHEYDEGCGLEERIVGGSVGLSKGLKSNEYFRSRVAIDCGYESLDYSYPEGYLDKVEKERAEELRKRKITEEQYLKLIQDYEDNLSRGSKIKRQYQGMLIGQRANFWVGGRYVMDDLDSKYKPTSGWTAGVKSKLFFGLLDSSVALKTEFEGAFFYPLVKSDNFDLNFSAKARLGMVDSLTSNGDILKKELYNVGGHTASGVGMLRGFRFAEAGPGIRTARLGRPYPIGAMRMATINVEVSMPIGKQPDDPSFHVFYDVGCGWKGQFKRLALNETEVDQYITNNGFGLRHACGIGLKMVKPMPICLDWGIKLNRKPGESYSEVSLGMHMPF